MKTFIEEIIELRENIKEMIAGNGSYMTCDGELHEIEDALKDEFIEDISKGKYTLDEIREISKEFDKLSQLYYTKYYA